MAQRIAFLFPGQGSQFLGMGQDLLQAFPALKEIFDQVDEVCGRSISRLCFEGPLDELTLTVNLQPAVTAVNLACLSVLAGSGVRPSVSAGHSLGEYAALAASGVVSGGDALRMVERRGSLMHREALANPGTMAAVIGLDIASVGEIVAGLAGEGVLAVANHNSANQIVITGEKGPVSRAGDAVKGQGGKAVPLKVSGAWHSPLMAGAVDDLRSFLGDIPFSRPHTPVLFNATADSEEDPDRIKDIMARQLTSPVRWYDIMLKMLADGVDTFVEVGPKNVLTGLLKKILSSDGEVAMYNVGDLKGLEGFLAVV